MTTTQQLIDIYNEAKSRLISEDILVSDYKDIAYGIQFSVTVASWSGIIRIYQNKKGVIRNDYSQIKSSDYSSRVISIIEQKKSHGEIEEKGTDNDTFNIGFPIIGTDESGKGDYFGPLVCAGVYLDERSAKILEFEGIKDCKKLSDKKNITLAQKIKTVCGKNHSIIEIAPEKYNALYEQFVKEKKNLNTLLAWGHAKAIEELLLKVECQTAVADQFADEKFILSKLQEKGRKLKLIQRHKAEQNIAVAAASILARARFIEKLSKLSSVYQIDLPKGVSAAVINNAKRIVKERGEQHLRKVAKLHFKTTKKVLSGL